MPTTTKDWMSRLSTEPATPNAANTSGGAENSRRTDAVGVEIPVVVHASRNSFAVRETAKSQQPVNEETRTVIVFPQGAVVRLTATLAVGEVVVLTNQRSGADVLCRVASVKAQPGIQNYVDLEFTQRAPGFWGDCFHAEDAPAFSPTEHPSPRTSGTFTPSLNRPASLQLAPVTTQPAAPQTLAQAVPPVVHSTLPAVRPEAAQAPSVTAPAALPTPPLASAGALRASVTPPADLQQPWSSIEASVEPAGTASGSRKIVMMAVAVVVLLSAIGGAIVLLRKGSAEPAARQSAITEQSLPATASAAIARPAPIAPSVPIAPQQPVASARQDVVASPRTETQSALSAPEPIGGLTRATPIPKQPSRRAVTLAVGKLATPVIKKPVAISSNEPPPLLPANAAASPIGNSLLLSSEQSSGPVSPATVARNTTLVGGRVLQPKLISAPPPTYPRQATLQRVQGDVVVDALVDVKGRVTDAKAISGSPLLQQAAINAVRLWRYEPARLDGEPVAAHMQVQISFHLP